MRRRARTDWVSGSPKRTLEFDDAQALRGQGQPAVEETGERGAAAGHLVDDGLGDGADDALDHARRCPRRRRVGAHAAGVRSRVAVADALEVLGGGERHGPGPVAEDEEGDLGSVEVVLDDDPVGDLEARVRVVEGRLPVGGDDDALARGEPVGLDDVRGAEVVDRGGRLVCGVGDDGARGRHPRRLHDLLGKRLRAFEVCGLGARTEDRERGLTQGVGDPGDERGLGSDDDEVDVEAFGERGHRLRVGGVERLVWAIAAIPGFPGAAMTASTWGSRLRARTRACSREPDPMTRTFTRPAYKVVRLSA